MKYQKKEDHEEDLKLRLKYNKMVDYQIRIYQNLNSINRKPITATQEELDSNPRSRSAKLRVGQRV